MTFGWRKAIARKQVAVAGLSSCKKVEVGGMDGCLALPPRSAAFRARTHLPIVGLGKKNHAMACRSTSSCSQG